MPIHSHAVVAVTALAVALIAGERTVSPEALVGLEVLEEGAAEWRAARPADGTGGAGCKLNFTASNGGARMIGIEDDSQVRTAIGWWARLIYADMYLRAGNSLTDVVNVDLACSAKRRFRLVLRQYTTARWEQGTSQAGSYTYYFPSSTTFTAPGTVDIKLGDLNRFFR